MNNQKKALLVALAVAGVSISGPMVKWSLSCGASPVMVAFGRMAISFLLLLIPALRSGELQAILRAPKKQVALACAAGLLLALHYTCWMTSLSFASTFVSTALVCTQPLFVAALSGVLLHEPIKREAVPGASMRRFADRKRTCLPCCAHFPALPMPRRSRSATGTRIPT